MQMTRMAVANVSIGFEMTQQLAQQFADSSI